VIYLFIYDITGNLINTLIKPDRIKRVVWDARDNNGNQCNAGVYFIKSNIDSITKKVLLTY